ncbi:MAG: rod shape-determining protein [Anaerolineae bacterium]|jgi:rod shape-determining protein MreB|nr:rod shape-determining protein [Anaerolineae bacterium]
MFSKRIGIDLGTVNVLVAYNNQIVLQEPSMVALTTGEQELVRAIGQDARDMWGRHPEGIEVMRPLRDGVIADYEVTEAMLRYFLRKIKARTFGRGPEVMISVPFGVTSVEKRAVYEAAIQAGARLAYLIPEPLAAAIGAGLPVTTPAGNMILNLGGGVAEAAVMAMGNIVVAHSVRAGGMRLDDAIINYMRRKYSLVIGEPTAEAVKIQIGAAVNLLEELYMEIQGRDQVSGLPRTITVATSEVVEAIQEPLAMIVGVAKRVLADTPPELASDIIDRGIVLTGGTALLRGIEQYITEVTGVPAYRSDDPMVAVAVGAVRALNNPSLMRGNLHQV